MNKYLFRKNIFCFAIAAAICSLLVCVGFAIAGGKSSPGISGFKISHFNISNILNFNSVDNVYEYDYTGKEIKPEVSRLVLSDEKGNAVFKYDNDISSVEYKGNTEIGYADIEVAVEGYEGTIIVEDAFRIRPQKVNDFKITATTGDTVDIVWTGVHGADGYHIYKSDDNGGNYQLVSDIKKKEPLTYHEDNMPKNATLTYYVSSYAKMGKEIVEGAASRTVTQYTPLATPAITGASYTAYNAIRLNWTPVDGATGYQIYKKAPDGSEYACIAELSDEWRLHIRIPRVNAGYHILII